MPKTGETISSVPVPYGTGAPSSAVVIDTNPRPVPVQPSPKQKKNAARNDDNSESIREKELEDKDVPTILAEKSPPWLISACLHFLLMVVLALIILPSYQPKELATKVVYGEYLGDPDNIGEIVGGPDAMGDDTVDFDGEVLNPVDNPMEVLPQAPKIFDVSLGGTQTQFDSANSSYIRNLLNGRDPGQRQGMMKGGGGNATTQACVEAALRWLAKNQKPDGSWSLVGPYADGVGPMNENRPAATGLALLAMQGNGVTTQAGLQRENVQRGWKWLLKQQDQDGCFFRDGPGTQRFYTQGICTIAICELYGMTKRAEFREPAEMAVKYCLAHQTKAGGWRYYVKSVDNDMSVTGWIVMALQSARMAGIDVPSENLARVSSYLDSIAMEGGSRYPYRYDEKATNAMTAEALLCREYLGWKRDDPRLIRGLESITRESNLVSFKEEIIDGVATKRDVYSWYYATQAIHHAGEPYWKKWNDVMRQSLPEQQIKTGKEAGSWHPDLPVQDEWSTSGGRLYVTCLSTYMLEVYFRHLPLYNVRTGYENEK